MGIGVYSITHKASGRFYVGQSRHMGRRFGSHKNLLRRGTHHSIYLQRAWNLYGESAFEFVRLKSCDTIDDALKEEQRILDEMFSTGVLFNMDKSNDPKIGIQRTRTAPARIRMSIARRDNPHLMELLAHAGRMSHTPEAQAKRNATLRSSGMACATLRIPVRATSVANGDVLRFISIAEAMKATGAGRGNIYSCCVGERRETKGFVFSYEWMMSDPNDPISLQNQLKRLKA
jgi:group I intron endonuclease